MHTYASSKFLYKSLFFVSVAIMAAKPIDHIPVGVAVIHNEEAAHSIRLNSHVRQFVKNYIRENRDVLHTVKLRSRLPFKTIDAVFAKYGLPKEIKYLAVVESELKATALSHVGARGPWQLMPETAALLGLKITPDVDERTLYYKSTVAAAKYLRDLHDEFGDWLLVLAAYNGGTRNVYRAIHKAGSRNFWDLQYYLPAESREHVKKFIASHYYFEGKGSVATLTKAEWTAYVQSTPPIMYNAAPAWDYSASVIVSR